jgi:hypothetical protein
MITLIDEPSRECLAIRAVRKMRSDHVLELFTELFTLKGVPEHIRSDNGAEMTAVSVRNWLGKVGSQSLFIEPDSPRENGYCESFNGKLRDELLNGDLLFPEGGAGTGRNLVEGAQHYPSAQLPRLPAASARGGYASAASGRKSELTTGIGLWGRSGQDLMGEPNSVFYQFGTNDSHRPIKSDRRICVCLSKEIIGTQECPYDARLRRS